MIDYSEVSPVSSAKNEKEFNWQLIAKRAKTERDLAFLKKREKELDKPVIQLYGSLDSGRQMKLKKLRRIITNKEAYLAILNDAVQNH